MTHRTPTSAHFSLTHFVLAALLVSSAATRVQEEEVDKWSFLLWQLGDPSFQPSPP